MYKRFLKVVLSLFIVLMNCVYLSAQEGPQEVAPRLSMGLTVQPGGMLVQHVPLGTTYDFYESVGIPLTIYNRDINSHTYILSTDKPSQVAARKWLKGYLEIPDPSWFWFEKTEVKVPANSKREVKMYLKIPNAEKYYNQHWSVALGVKGKPEPGQMLALAVSPRIQIETLSKVDVNERPSGSLIAVPSALIFEDISLGKRKKLSLKIFNNDEKRHRYKLTSMIFPSDPKKRQIFPSPGYAWIPDPRWIRPEKRSIVVKGRQSREVIVSVKVPLDREHYGRKWEAILFVEARKTLPGFARIQIKTERMKEGSK